MTPLPLNHRYTGTGDGSITTTTYIMTQPSNHRTHHLISSNYPKWGQTIIISDTHNSNHSDVIFLITNWNIVIPTKIYYFYFLFLWDQPLWAGWEGKKNQLKQACFQHCIKVTTNDHVLPPMCAYLITIYHNYIVRFVN